MRALLLQALYSIRSERANAGGTTGVQQPQTLKPQCQQALETIDIQEHSLAELADQAQITSNNAAYAFTVHAKRSASR